MKQKFFLVIEDVVKTRFMQVADIFEKSKFVGRITEAKGELTRTPKEILQAMVEKAEPDSPYRTVGIIVEGGRSTFVSGRAAYSDGHDWIIVNDLCQKLGGSSPEVIQ